MCPWRFANAQDPAEPSAPESDEAKLEQAKAMFIEGEKLFAAGEFKAAEEKYEQAYFMYPGKHGFAYKVGIAAWKAGDCKKADEYFRHFVQYETDKVNKSAELAEANRVIGKIAVEGCPEDESAPEGADAGGDAGAPEPQPEPTVSIGEDPMGRDDVEDAPGTRQRKLSPLMIGGIASLGVGVAGLALGVGSYIKLQNDTDLLVEKSNNDTTVDYPAGNYANDRIAKADRQVGLWNGLWIGGTALAATAGATGVALIVTDTVLAKKRGRTAKRPTVAPVVSRTGAGASFSMQF